VKVGPEEELPEGFFDGIPVENLPPSGPDYEMCRKIRQAAVSAGFRPFPRIAPKRAGGMISQWEGTWPYRDGTALIWAHGRPNLSYRGACPDVVSGWLHHEMERLLEDKLK
jgi:hypothetical protein